MTTALEQPSRISHAIEAAAGIAEQLDIPVTMRQLEALITAAAPHIVRRLGTVPGRPTHRLVHSLIAAGWTQSALASRVGMSTTDFSQMMSRPALLPRTATVVARVFVELHGTDPAEHGVGPKGVTRSLNAARVNGWTVLSDAEVAVVRAQIAEVAS